MSYIVTLILVSLFAAFVLLLCRKWGIIEYVQVHGNEFFSQMFSCDFCLSWWAGVVISALIALFALDVQYLTIPFFSTVVTRKLIC
jgi:hypothetical protein